MITRNVRRPWSPPTLRDIARESGASLATVSRALAAWASSDPSRPKATDEVIDAATKFGYPLERGHGVRRLIVFTSDIGRTGYWETLQGVCDAARERDVEVSIFLVSGAPATRRSTLASALQTPINGAVVLEFDSPSVEILNLLPIDLPVAIAGGFPGEDDVIPRAWIDDYQGAVLATQYLVGLGHRRIGFVGTPPSGHPDPRVQGWRDVVHAHGLPMVRQLGTGWFPETGRRASGNALRVGATAILCGNDDLAFGVLAGLADVGVRVPEQMSVIGMDDHPFAASSTPLLTTVRQDFARVGEVAVHLALDGGFGSGNETAVMVPPELQVRGSTGAPPT